MKILVITQNYPPDLGAGAFRMKSLVEALLAKGHEVVVLTGTPNRYEMDSTVSESGENPKERILRVKIRIQKMDIFQRGINYWIFFRKALKQSLKAIEGARVVLATSPQLLVAYVGAIASKKAKIPFILDVRDLWPDVMLDLKVATSSSLIYRTLKNIEKKCYNRANTIIINSPLFFEPIKRISGKESILITNGIDDELFYGLPQMPCKRKKVKPFLITYAGNIGIAQDLMILTEVARNFSDDFSFCLIGDGSEKKQIDRMIQEKGIKNIQLLPPINRNELLEYYENTDAFFVHLKNVDMFKKTIPSKIFEYIATGKPVLYGLRGISQEMMKELQGDVFSFESGNPDSLSLQLNAVKANLEKGEYCNQAGREILKNKYLRSKLNTDYVRIIEETVKNAH